MPKSQNPLQFLKESTPVFLKTCEKFAGPYFQSEIRWLANAVRDAGNQKHSVYFSLRKNGNKTSVTIYLRRMGAKLLPQPLSELFLTANEKNSENLNCEIYEPCADFSETLDWIVNTLKMGHTPVILEKNEEHFCAFVRNKMGDRSID